MKKLIAFWAVLALTTVLFLGASAAKADDQPGSPATQMISDQGSPAEPQPAEQQPEVQQVEEEQSQPAPDQTSQPDKQ